MHDRFKVGVLVANNFNVLPRVTGLFSKRGFNIHSIAANTLDNSELSEITIVAAGDMQVREQVVKQLYKLIDVKQVTMLS